MNQKMHAGKIYFNSRLRVSAASTNIIKVLYKNTDKT